MRAIVIGDRQVEMPAPIYIIPDTVKVSEETGTMSGKCIFPSSDPTVGERVDHVNICHEMFVLWNCAHIWAQRKGWGRLFAIKTRQEVVGGRMTPPDTEIDFVTSLTNVRKHGGRVVGSAKAEFSLGGKPLLLVNVDRFIEEKI
ncbi:MAG: hypothetical protein A3A26_00860 [Candidatus Zambryskibacteria bacterium RIFCSPLOWO2_01_FULL_47_14]|uniref:Uncharacterized protein n=1 Tax=Candidatus Zambryskibacteria bacterium RIFCSPLOWO2_01_FULL_47_14 TaxID=1802763 RepID=A0A1G2UA60_9BACT|nr:MAG: hypothetical protein A3A26_00860 [Candidatus Zambryskibacteria bacterium RIFCSPLOWO2_01_FULL_47_14]